MAETIESLVIKVGLDPGKLLDFLNSLDEELKQAGDKAQTVGNKIDEALASGSNKSAGLLNQTGDAAEKTKQKLIGVSESGLKAGKATEQGAKKAESALQKLDNTAGKVFGALKSYFAPLAAMFGGQLMFTNFINEAEELGKVSDAVRMNVSEIDAWRKANVAAGGSAEAFTSAMQSFTERTGASGEVFLRMGKQLNGMTGQQANYALKYLGLTKESAAVFLQNNKQMNELVDSYRAMALTPKDAENARRFKIAWQTTGMAVQHIGNQFAKFFLPIVETVVDKFRDAAVFIGRHSQFIEIALTGIATAAALAFGPKGMLASIKLLFSPLGVLIGSFILLVGAIDDLMSFTKGGNSLFGEILKEIGMTDEEIQGLRESFKKIGESFTTLGENLKPLIKQFGELVGPVIKTGLQLIVTTIGGIVAGINALISDTPETTKAFEDMSKAFEKAWENATEAVKDLFKKLWDAVANMIPEWMKHPIDSASKGVEKAVKSLRGRIRSLFGFSEEEESATPKTPGDQGVFSVMSNTKNAEGIAAQARKNVQVDAPMTVQTTVNVNGNADPQAVRDGVVGAMDQSLAVMKEFTENSVTGVVGGN